MPVDVAAEVISNRALSADYNVLALSAPAIAASSQPGQFVMVKDGGLVTAYDARTGQEVYVQERAAATGRYYASPVAANGNIYFTSLDDGVVTVLKAGTDKPEVIARNPGLGERVAATPAIADNALYVRSEKHLYAFGDKK